MRDWRTNTNKLSKIALNGHKVIVSKDEFAQIKIRLYLSAYYVARSLGVSRSSFYNLLKNSCQDEPEANPE